MLMPADGQLMSRGSNDSRRLGRPAEDVPGTRFGRVRLDGILDIASGASHVLAMAAEKVGNS